MTPQNYREWTAKCKVAWTTGSGSKLYRTTTWVPGHITPEQDASKPRGQWQYVHFTHGKYITAFSWESY